VKGNTGKEAKFDDDVAGNCGEEKTTKKQYE